MSESAIPEWSGVAPETIDKFLKETATDLGIPAEAVSVYRQAALTHWEQQLKRTELNPAEQIQQKQRWFEVKTKMKLTEAGKKTLTEGKDIVPVPTVSSFQDWLIGQEVSS